MSLHSLDFDHLHGNFVQHRKSLIVICNMFLLEISDIFLCQSKTTIALFQCQEKHLNFFTDFCHCTVVTYQFLDIDHLTGQL